MSNPREDYLNEIDEKKEDIASFKEYLTPHASPSDHLPRKTGKNKVIWNIMTQSGPHSLDGGTGGFVTENPETKIGNDETKEDYKKRLFGDGSPSVKRSIVASVRNDPDLEFFLLQEAPKVVKVSEDEKIPEENIGQEFIDETLKKLNEGCEPGQEKWACTTQYNTDLSKCVFYRCDKYTVNEEYTEKLAKAVKSSAHKLSDKECFAPVFKEKGPENPGMHVLCNVHLAPGRPDAVEAEAEITTLFDKAKEVVPKDLLKTIFVGGDCNFNVGLGGQQVMPAETSVNTYDVKNAGRVGLQAYNSVDAGFEKSFITLQNGENVLNPHPPLVRSEEQVINPLTGVASRRFPPHGAMEQIKENSYSEVLFGNLSRSALKIDIASLKTHLESLAVPPGEEAVQVESVKIEANNHNAHRIAITSMKPILYYEDLIAQHIPGITVELTDQGLKYCLQLDGEQAVPKETYEPASMHVQLTKLKSQEIMTGYFSHYERDISIKRKELEKLTSEKEKYKNILDEKISSYRDWAEDKAIEDYLNKLDQKDNKDKEKELKDELKKYEEPGSLDSAYGARKRAVLKNLRGDEKYKEIFSEREQTSKMLREIENSALQPGEDVIEKRARLEKQQRSLEKQLSDMTEETLKKDDKFQQLQALKTLRDDTEANLKRHPEVMVAQRNDTVNEFDIITLTQQLNDLLRVADTLSPQSTKKINLILKECRAYEENLKDSHLFDGEILNQKRASISKLISYLENPNMLATEKLAGFREKLNENKQTLEQRNDKAWAKAAKVILSVLFVWTVVVPYTFWKKEGKERIKKMENIATKENDAPRLKAR
ncbi:MAG: hypothetical protein K0S27_1365 [Gammaproteobacteria bacterium]|jgi:hypothetical protein|nr:hypothetical protein [Gammaproteobacteria bacterium]